MKGKGRGDGFCRVLKTTLVRLQDFHQGQEHLVGQLAAHNASFDGAFLVAWFQRLGMFLPARRQVLCTMQRAMWHFAESRARNPKDFKLATLCQHFQIPFHAATAHEALADVSATVRLYRAIQAADQKKCLLSRIRG